METPQGIEAMNELEKLEKELASLQPDDPTGFSKKVENALKGRHCGDVSFKFIH